MSTTAEAVRPHDPDEKPLRTQSAHDTVAGSRGWRGPTYYGRSQLKPAPFENWVVGGYIFLAGVSGAASMISAVADLTQGRRQAGLVRRGRYLSLMAPLIGSALLVYDLHTPKRFYNMLRIAKKTSPMSIGTWILMAFSGFSVLGAAAEFAAGRGRRWRGLARAAHVPAALAGAGLSTYTAALLSATSTPLWAAAPRTLAVRFGASAFATGAAALSLGEPRRRTRRRLDALTMAALAAEAVAAGVSHRVYAQKGVDEALRGRWGAVERYAVNGAGTALPLSLLALSRGRGASDLASLAVLAGGLLLRVAIMGAGDVSAADPNISFRFSQPENLPGRRRKSP